MVLSNNNIFKCDLSKNVFNKFYIFYNKLIETDIRLVVERCVTSFLRGLTNIDHLIAMTVTLQLILSKIVVRDNIPTLIGKHVIHCYIKPHVFLINQSLIEGVSPVSSTD